MKQTAMEVLNEFRRTAPGGFSISTTERLMINYKEMVMEYQAT
jgi:hypothetical protein